MNNLIKNLAQQRLYRLRRRFLLFFDEFFLLKKIQQKQYSMKDPRLELSFLKKQERQDHLRGTAHAFHRLMAQTTLHSDLFEDEEVYRLTPAFAEFLAHVNIMIRCGDFSRTYLLKLIETYEKMLLEEDQSKSFVQEGLFLFEENSSKKD